MGYPTMLPRSAGVLEEVSHERARQDAKWGEQNHPDGTGGERRMAASVRAREICEQMFAMSVGTWRHILVEEVTEAMAESDPAALRAELIQVAAVAVAWVEKIDRDIAGGAA